MDRFMMASSEGKFGRRRMGNHAVTLRVTPFLRIECKFWLTDDGWNGSCEQPSITVQAGTFEFAKSEMEIAIGKYIESLLREAQSASTGQAA
jgi:predicted RNase H-like HicB family nuclease